MEWLNLHTSVLDSPEVIGADPVERSTWLMIQRFCIGQENGGRIRGCRDWKDRKWQQLVRVTKREVEAESELWEWDGDDLIVSFYPAEKEDEVKTNRLNGKKGGRPRKRTDGKTEAETEKKPPGFGSVNPSETGRLEIAKTERKGKEGERKGTDPPTPQKPESKNPESVGQSVGRKADSCGGMPPTTSFNQLSGVLTPQSGCTAFNGDSRGISPDLDTLKTRINALKPEWAKPARWNYAEEQHLFGGAAAQFSEMDADDWSLITRYLATRMPQGAGYWQPNNRAKFVETFANVFADAQRWANKTGNAPKPKSKPLAPGWK